MTAPIPSPGEARSSVPASRTFNRWVLEVLVVFNLFSQAVLVVLVLLGPSGREALPVAAGATVALGLLAAFYGRWLLPMLRWRHLLALLLFKELAMAVVAALAVGLVAMLRWAL